MNAVRNFLPDLFAKFNAEFITFLELCYTLRYTDQLPVDFTVTVFARETLAELDHTIFHSERQLNLRQGSEPVLTAYRSAVDKKEPLLFTDNHVLLGVAKADFLKQPDTAYAILNRRVGGLLEAEFTVYESPADGRFNRPGIWPVSAEELQRQLAEEENQR